MNKIRCSRVFVVLLIVLFSTRFAHADGGVLYVTPASGEYVVGDTFDVEVMADTGGQAMNAAEADLAFDTQGLAVDHVSMDSSVLGSWSTKPAFDNTKGTIQFGGWTKEGQAGNELLLTITFKALRDSSSGVRFVSGTILAGSDKATNIISTMRPAIFTVTPKEAPAPIAVADTVASTPDATTSEQSSGTSPTAPSAADGQDASASQAAAAGSTLLSAEGDTASSTSPDGSDAFLLMALIVAMLVLGLSVGYALHHPRVRGRRR
jgi:hypothetical protein